MAHMVESVDQIYTFDGQSTWHGVNTVQGRKPKDAQEAYELSGLDWTVSVEPLRFEEKTQSPIGMIFISGEIAQLSRAITTRGPKGERIELGGCGKSWTPLQNKELFERAHPFVENGFAEYETAGSIRGRKSVWVSLSLGVDYVDSDDPVAKRILLTNSHDTTAGARAGWCPRRTVCNNTLSANLRDGRFLEIRHGKNVSNNFQLITEAMDVVNKKWLMTMDVYRKLSKVVVNNDKFDQYVTKCFIGSAALVNKFHDQEETMLDQNFSPEMIEQARRQFESQLFPDIRQKVREARETAPGARLKTAYGTAWGALNAITYVTSHMKGSSAEGRLRSTLFGGEGGRINTRALELAQKL